MEPLQMEQNSLTPIPSTTWGALRRDAVQLALSAVVSAVAFGGTAVVEAVEAHTSALFAGGGAPSLASHSSPRPLFCLLLRTTRARQQLMPQHVALGLPSHLKLDRQASLSESLRRRSYSQQSPMPVSLKDLGRALDHSGTV